MTLHSDISPIFHLDGNLEGINNKQYTFSDTKYVIKNYDRDYVCDDDTFLRRFKTVITDENDNVLCIGPSKSVSYDYFVNNNVVDDSIEITRCIEGTMINMFYNHTTTQWIIATRSAIGGQYFYFRNQYYCDKFSDKAQQSFYDMFMDALQAGEKENLNDLKIMDLFNKDYCYSFVLQHPDNHIVISTDHAKLYIVGIHKIINNNSFLVVDKSEYQNFDFVKTLSGMIDVPEIFDNCETFDKIKEKYASIQDNYRNMGVMIYNKITGIRTKVLCDSYINMKLLRGNNPNIQYQYICLRRTNKVQEFLEYFPQYKKLFFKFYENYKHFMKGVHQSYFKHYIKKSPERISNKYMPHIYRIHQECFVPYMMKGERKVIKIDDVYKYFDNRNVGEILYALNYDNRTS